MKNFKKIVSAVTASIIAVSAGLSVSAANVNLVDPVKGSMVGYGKPDSADIGTITNKYKGTESAVVDSTHFDFPVITSDYREYTMAFNTEQMISTGPTYGEWSSSFIGDFVWEFDFRVDKQQPMSTTDSRFALFRVGDYSGWTETSNKGANAWRLNICFRDAANSSATNGLAVNDDATNQYYYLAYGSSGALNPISAPTKAELNKAAGEGETDYRLKVGETYKLKIEADAKTGNTWVTFTNEVIGYTKTTKLNATFEHYKDYAEYSNRATINKSSKVVFDALGVVDMTLSNEDFKIEKYRTFNGWLNPWETNIVCATPRAVNTTNQTLYAAKGPATILALYNENGMLVDLISAASGANLESGAVKELKQTLSTQNEPDGNYTAKCFMWNLSTGTPYPSVMQTKKFTITDGTPAANDRTAAE